MQVTRILAIRHGETPWNVDTRIQGQLDIGLNDTGKWQAQRVGHALREEHIAAIYSSDLVRAFETAQAIAQSHTRATQLSVVGHTGLRERHFGHLQGQTWAEIESGWPEDAKLWRGRDPYWSPLGGESLTAVRERIASCVAELACQHLGEQIVLVAHGGVMDALYRLATNQPVEAPRTWHLGNAAVNRLLWTPQGLSLVGWGDVSHFDDAQGSPRDETTT
ncbi:histidine phosphatase family protein [Limnohabitans sp. Rim8]|uniref:histidine phosphatase family protein n=1 Tax=Limnohabitans sp. Rim8 TaxID=1100718 RepID=UPI000D38A6A8|nr:histidine phosphatase family protein [Limnohabitans sp. Rim8]PUE62303.1 histidine phosphatase family protein [Limnohabitans sp. Rim8]